MVDYRYNPSSEYQIGLTPQTLVSFSKLGVPPPDQPIFSPAAVYYVRSDGTRVGDGDASADWIWDVMSVASLHRILDFLDGADYKALYIRTNTKDASTANPAESFNVYYVIMWRPILTGQEGTPIARSDHTFQAVRIHFSKAQIQPGYL